MHSFGNHVYLLVVNAELKAMLRCLPGPFVISVSLKSLAYSQCLVFVGCDLGFSEKHGCEKQPFHLPEGASSLGKSTET